MPIIYITWHSFFVKHKIYNRKYKLQIIIKPIVLLNDSQILQTLLQNLQ